MLRISRVLLVALAAATLLPAVPAAAHAPLPAREYPCLNQAETQLTNRTLVIRAGKEYAFKNSSTGDRIGSAGEFVHPGDSNRIRFTSGYLANHGWRATHSAVTKDGFTFYKVTMKRYVDGDLVNVLKCSPQSG